MLLHFEDSTLVYKDTHACAFSVHILGMVPSLCDEAFSRFRLVRAKFYISTLPARKKTQVVLAYWDIEDSRES